MPTVRDFCVWVSMLRNCSEFLRCPAYHYARVGDSVMCSRRPKLGCDSGLATETGYRLRNKFNKFNQSSNVLRSLREKMQSKLACLD
jgi:hypothetical protein